MLFLRDWKNRNALLAWDTGRLQFALRLFARVNGSTGATLDARSYRPDVAWRIVAGHSPKHATGWRPHFKTQTKPKRIIGVWCRSLQVVFYDVTFAEGTAK
uniref:Uncharacterized protein n=1 Tax=uncultured Caudovirales phage TaxID=2100421 RepID=A0A6J5LAP4_9CAUD|nr:hypothetical protein UFOVP114_99 [uncultured Caudovirales phage]